MEKGSIISNLRKPRVFGMAIFDWVTSILGAVIISKIFKINMWIALLSIVPLSLLFHVIFKVDSKFLRYFKENNWVKAGVAIIVVLIIIISLKK